ncbi:hypothetical protein B296_00033897, partial [Ensete ventricosum]
MDRYGEPWFVITMVRNLMLYRRIDQLSVWFCSEWISLLERFLPRQIAVTRAKRDWELDVISRYRLLVHFFRPVPKEYLHSAELRDIMQFGSSNTAVFFKMRVAGVLHIFQFETKQGEEICVALQTHINDVMLRRYAKARSGTGGSSQGDISQTVRAPGLDLYEKRVQDLSRAAEESQKNADRVSNLHDSALLDKSNLEAALARANIKERFPVDSNHEKELLVVSNKHGKGDLIMGSMKTDSVDTKDIDRKNEQTAAILKKQGAQLIELEALYKEEQ